MGRFRGGLSTRIHALVDAEGRPIRLTLTPGQAGDAPVGSDFAADLDAGAILIADRAHDTNAYDTNDIRAGAEDRGVWTNIPPRVIRKDAFSFSPRVYRQRNLVERFFHRIKQIRGRATRYDRKPENHLAALKLAAIRIWLART